MNADAIRTMQADSPNILLITADRRIATLRKQILRSAGYTVTVIVQPKRLPSVWRAFDAVVLGYALPSQERRKISEDIRRRDPKIPIVVVCSDPEDVDPAANICLSIVNDSQAMLEALKEFLGYSRGATRS